jgi:hypothetical protein
MVKRQRVNIHQDTRDDEDSSSEEEEVHHQGDGEEEEEEEDEQQQQQQQQQRIKISLKNDVCKVSSMQISLQRGLRR